MNQYISMSMSDDKSQLSSTPLASFTPLDFPGWQGLSIEDKSLFMFIFDIEANADEFPLHASDQNWLAYVIEGNGILYAGTTDNKEKTSEIPFSAGDAISFEANVPHGWKVNNIASKILFCRKQ